MSNPQHSNVMIPKDLLPIIGQYTFPSIHEFCRSLTNDNEKEEAIATIIRSINNHKVLDRLSNETSSTINEQRCQLTWTTLTECVKPYDISKLRSNLYDICRAEISGGITILTFVCIHYTGLELNVSLNEDRNVVNMTVIYETRIGYPIYDYKRDKYSYGLIDRMLWDAHIVYYKNIVECVWEMCNAINI